MTDPELPATDEAPFLEHGSAQPLGASWTGRGINFAAFSAHATRIELCLFDSTGRTETARIALPARTGNIWHASARAAAAPSTTRSG